MKQLNLKISDKFEMELKRLMKSRNIKHKAEAIRVAVSEALQRSQRKGDISAFRELLGAGLRAPLNKKAKMTEDDLWS